MRGETMNKEWGMDRKIMDSRTKVRPVRVRDQSKILQKDGESEEL